MATPDMIGEALSNFTFDVGINWAKWGIYIFVFILLALVGYAFTHFSSFKIICDEFPIYGSGKDGVLSVGKKRMQRFKKIKGGAAWLAMLPLFNKKEIEPFDDEYIYPGNRVYAFAFNDVMIPGRLNITVEDKQISEEKKKELEDEVKRYLQLKHPLQQKKMSGLKININKSESQIRAEVNPVPHYWRNWQSLQHKKNAQEFAEENWWAENKYAVMLIVTCFICAGLVALSIWWNFKYAGAASQKIFQSNAGLADALRNFNTIPGK